MAFICDECRKKAGLEHGLKRGRPPMANERERFQSSIEVIGFLRSCILSGESLSEAELEEINKFIADWQANAESVGPPVKRIEPVYYEKLKELSAPTWVEWKQSDTLDDFYSDPKGVCGHFVKDKKELEATQ